MDNVVANDYQVPPLEEVAMGDQILDVPSSMIDGDIRATFLNFDQSMTSQANAFNSQVQSMTAQVNRVVGPRVPQHANTISSHLRDFANISLMRSIRFSML